MMQHLMRVFLTALFLLSAATASVARDSEFVLVKEGKARAVIVVADDANQNTLEAAAALQKVVNQMTGAQLPVRKAGEFHDEAAPVFVGMSPLARKAGVKVAQGRGAFLNQ
jgi:hypothetical protein